MGIKGSNITFIFKLILTYRQLHFFDVVFRRLLTMRL